MRRLLSLFGALIFSCSPLLAADDEGKWGFVNVKGDFIIRPKFANAGAFHDGLAPVQVDIKNDESTVQRWGFIDKHGKMAIEPQFEEVLGFTEGLAAAKLPDQKWGYIDSSGNFVIPAQFEKADCFSEGLAAASDGHWGYIDKSGKWVIKPQYQVACRFSGDRAAVLPENRSVGMLTLNVSEDVYNADGGYWNYIDKTGKVVIDTLFEGTGVFGDGLAPVAVGANQGAAVPDKWGFANKDGILQIKPQFANVHAPAEGTAAVQTGTWKDIGQGYRTWMPGKWGYINLQGQQVIPSKFEGADPFSEGMAGVLIDGKWGYIDKTGKVVIPAKFKANGYFREELAPVCLSE